MAYPWNVKHFEILVWVSVDKLGGDSRMTQDEFWEMVSN